MTLLTTYRCKGSLADPECQGRKSFPYQQYSSILWVFSIGTSVLCRWKQHVTITTALFGESTQEVARLRLKNSNGNETEAQKTVREVKQCCVCYLCNQHRSGCVLNSIFRESPWKSVFKELPEAFPEARLGLTKPGILPPWGFPHFLLPFSCSGLTLGNTRYNCAKTCQWHKGRNTFACPQPSELFS